MNVIDSLKRLERAGAENSRTTEKLRDAAAKVAEKVENLTKGLDVAFLPRGYRIENHRGSDYLMSPEIDMEDYCPQRFALYPGSSMQEPTRAAILRFAEDIEGGWLDEVAELLESRAVENDEAIGSMTNAHPAGCSCGSPDCPEWQADQEVA